MENENENLNSPNTEEEDLDSLNKVEIQEGETDTDKIAKLDDANKKLFARAKRAEEEVKALKNKPQEPEKPKEQPVQQQKPQEVDVDKLLDEKLNERDLSSMDLSDNLKSEVRAYAKVKNIHYRDAEKSEYISFLKQKEAEKITADEASATSKGTTIKAKRDFANLSEEDIKNLDDDSFKGYKSWLKSQG